MSPPSYTPPHLPPYLTPLGCHRGFIEVHIHFLIITAIIRVTRVRFHLCICREKDKISILSNNILISYMFI